MSVVENSPVVGDEDTASRVRYVGYFFEQALDEREDMIEEFQGGCIGPH
jgi:hypothetical protein